MIGFYYYLRVIWQMYFVPAEVAEDEEVIVTGAHRQDSRSGTATVAAQKVLVRAPAVPVPAIIGLTLALIATVGLGIFPASLIDLARQAAGLP
jgi:NADH:ubiquinone oxidoreductase subunit 2 (subunit N)